MIRFADFTLDPANRTLTRAGVPVELSGRYLDALALMAAEPGALVTKDRFMAEVWRGVPVTDEALTQCIRSLRRALGDDAAAPRFIETVPKHGYRFIGAAPARRDASPRRRALLLGAAGTLGGGAAGLAGGIAYGFLGALGSGSGAASALVVLALVTALVGLAGGAGVGFGIALAGPRWGIAGGAAGGLLVGGIAKLLGLDAFTLLLGRSPGNITGAAEGLAVGAAAGAAVWVATRVRGPAGIVAAGGIGAATGAAIVLAGGRLMAGSLALLAERFPDARMRLALFDAGSAGEVLSGAAEVALFAVGLAAAMRWVARQLDRQPL